MTASTLLIGGPGAGKTTRLLKVVEDALTRGVRPDELAFCAFTRAASGEARERAKARFGLADADLPLFRTLHSLCFRALGLSRSAVVSREHLAELSEAAGESAPRGGDGTAPALGAGSDPLLTIDGYARTTMRGLRDGWADHGGEVDWRRQERFSAAYARYKLDRDLLDFTDMLARYAEEGAPVRARVAIVDEAQDLTPLQWAVVRRAFPDAEELWIAGDDLQSIHRWAGAAEEEFLSLSVDRREVLPTSHRLPRAVHELAGRIAARVSRKYDREWGHSGREGKVEWVAGPEDVDLSSGSWLLLARTHHLLARLEEAARAQGVCYLRDGKHSADRKVVRAIQAWEALRAGGRVEPADAELALRAAGARADVGDGEATLGAADFPNVDFRTIWHDALVRVPVSDREYLLSCLRRGENLVRPPRVRIETIHGAKGAEAERVLLLTDLTWRTQRGFELDACSEHRVFYVGATRASEALYLAEPSSFYGYQI